MNFYDVSSFNVTPAPGTRIIRRAELADLVGAQDLLTRSNAAAEETRRKADEDYQRRYDEGFSQGLEEGKQEYADKLLELIMSQVDILADLERDMAGVVNDCVRKIIGELPDDEVIRRVVRRAINTVRGMKRLMIRVSREDEEAVRDELQALLVSPDGSSGYIELSSDASLHHGDCIMETHMGIINASLDLQLDHLMRSIEERIQQKNAE